MDKVLKRVGLSKRGSEIKNNQSLSPERENSVIITKRRRCDNRRFLHEKKLRGLFNIDWESVKYCKSCKSKAMTKKLCGKRCDNELYRSNSFKFERFVRCGDEISSLGQTVSLCDDYSLPIDYVKKKRPKSIAANSTEWNINASDEQIKVDGQDGQYEAKASSQPVIGIDKSFCGSTNRKCFQTHVTEYSSDSSSNEEFFITCEKIVKYSPDSVSETIVSLLPAATTTNSNTNNLPAPSTQPSDVKRYPSPYYYADLYKSSQKNSPETTTNKEINAEKDLNKKSTTHEKSSEKEKELFVDSDEKQSSHNRYTRSYSLETGKSDSVKKKDSNSHLKHLNAESQSTDSNNIRASFDYNTDSEQPKKLNDPINDSSSPCVSSLFPSQTLLNEDDMTRKRHLYETAFDCSVTHQEGEREVDQIDKLSNHPVLVQLTSNKSNHASAGSSTDCDTQSCKVTLCQDETSIHNKSLDKISQNLQDMHLDSKDESSKISRALLLRVYTPSPPASTPLSSKYYSKSNDVSSTGSFSNIPSNVRRQHRMKDLRLPVKSLQVKLAKKSEESTEPEDKDDRDKEQKNVLEIKDRTRKMFKRHKDGTKDIIRFSKGCHRRHKYSSTESMTSSSGGSMESLQSSTSEGNRSTSSSESRQSTSLSSHSSDSGNTSYHLPQTYNFLIHTNKLNILSPISDKSSQEPASETSDNNRNNNSQKCSPEEVLSPSNIRPKKRLPLNKNVLNLGFHGGDTEIQGSDSGISIQSREGKTIFGFMMTPNPDLSDLPFDMPKLRCRRLLQEDACTSGSATSVDLRDLPFDMPKLKRRLRPQSHLDAKVSQASSSQSMADMDKPENQLKPVLSLNLKEGAEIRQRPGLSLSFGRLGLNLNIKNNPTNEMIDANLPLERQGWYHGAITRIEAEFVLKFLKEGSFLVRNSESTRQDYSLSLKSARGFMHMRIQRNGTDSFILGQFSKPFKSIPEMIHHFSLNRLPVRGAEHMCLLQPVIAQLL